MNVCMYSILTRKEQAYTVMKINKKYLGHSSELIKKKHLFKAEIYNYKFIDFARKKKYYSMPV